MHEVLAKVSTFLAITTIVYHITRRSAKTGQWVRKWYEVCPHPLFLGLGVVEIASAYREETAWKDGPLPVGYCVEHSRAIYWTGDR